MRELLSKKKWLIGLVGCGGLFGISTMCVMCSVCAGSGSHAPRVATPTAARGVPGAQAPVSGAPTTAAENGQGDAPSSQAQPSADAGPAAAAQDTLAEQSALEREHLSLWDDPDAVSFTAESLCPDDFWSIIPGASPPWIRNATNEFERRRLQAERPSRATTARALSSKPIIVRNLSGVRMGDYDLRRRRFPVEIDAVTSCSCPGTSVEPHIALTPPRVAVERLASRESGNAYQMREWTAQPIRTYIEVPAAEAEQAAAELRRGTGFLGLGSALHADIAFNVGRVQVDTRVERFADGPMDLGAGPIVHTRRLGLRIRRSDGQVVIDTLRPGTEEE